MKYACLCDTPSHHLRDILHRFEIDVSIIRLSKWLPTLAMYQPMKVQIAMPSNTSNNESPFDVIYTSRGATGSIRIRAICYGSAECRDI